MDSWSFLEGAGMRLLWGFSHLWWGSIINYGGIIKSTVQSLPKQVHLLKDKLSNYGILVVDGQKSQL